MNPYFRKLTVCLDMCGCPNRCRHCWLGASPNGNLGEDDLRDVAAEFRPFTENLEVFDWYREPDYHDRYRERWDLTGELSDHKTPHFENISVWRAARDDGYVPWLYSLGVRAAQLTIAGDEAATDAFCGRKGAYRDLLETISRLLRAGIAPRLQTFVNKSSLGQLPHILSLIEELQLERRCAGLERPFSFFLHQGTCDGENERWYEQWITPEDIAAIPPRLAEYTLRHFGKSSLVEVLGRPEGRLCQELEGEGPAGSLVSGEPVFYVDGDFQVYPNHETPSRAYCLGNLKELGAAGVLENYLADRTPAQRVRGTVPVSEMVRRCGDPQSRRLFLRGDYIDYIHNKYCRMCAEPGGF